MVKKLFVSLLLVLTLASLAKSQDTYEVPITSQARTWAQAETNMNAVGAQACSMNHGRLIGFNHPYLTTYPNGYRIYANAICKLTVDGE